MIPDKATAIKSINPTAKFSYTKVDFEIFILNANNPSFF